MVNQDSPALPTPALTTDEAYQALGIWGILRLLGRKKWWLFGIPIFLSICVGIYLILSPPIYTATARVLPPQYNQYNVNNLNSQLGGESTLGNAAVSVKNPSDLYIGILRSVTILDAIIAKHKLAQHYKLDIRDDLHTRLLGATEVEVGKDGILVIRVEDTSAERAANLANGYVEELYNFSRDLAKRESARRTEFYESVLNDAKKRLHESDLALYEIEKSTGYTKIEGHEEAIVEASASLQRSIAEKQAMMQSLLTFATEQHPSVISLRSEINDLQRQLEATQKGSTRRTDSQLTGLGKIPSIMLEHKQRSREVEYWKNMVELLGRYNELGKIDETRDLSLIQVLDKAIAQHYKSKPKVALGIILTFIFSFVLTFVTIVLADWLRQYARANPSFALQLQAVLKAWLGPRLGQWLSGRFFKTTNATSLQS